MADKKSPPKEKPTILLLSDDIRTTTGIATMSNNIIMKSVDRFNWVQVAGAQRHLEEGKLIDFSEAAKKVSGVEDAMVHLIPRSGYGDRNLLLQVLSQYKVDAIVHFTDPRFWEWLYAMEYELRSEFKIPIVYYAIWDNYPVPMWNINSYGSCTAIGGISMQSHNIHNTVLAENGFNPIDLDDKTQELPTKMKYKQVLTKYIPHGVDENIYKPLPEDDELLVEANNRFKKDVDYLVYWSNKNMLRKRPGDVILAFKQFAESLDTKERKRVKLLMHTEPANMAGTDLTAIIDHMCQDLNVQIVNEMWTPEFMNAVYNAADVVVNIAVNEGWGLSNTEAMMAGTPTITAITGGLQDQCGFKVKDTDEPIVLNSQLPSLSQIPFLPNAGEIIPILSHGDWVYPIFPASRSLQGSIPTPYIWYDYVNIEDVAIAMAYWYRISAEDREERGNNGRIWAIDNGLTAQNMSDGIANLIETSMNLFTPGPKWVGSEVQYELKYENMGII